jgi:predicted nucleotidyltransferase
MRISKGAKILDIPVVKIRDFFKKTRSLGFSKSYIGTYFTLNTRKINLLIKELIRLGYIEKYVPNEKSDMNIWHEYMQDFILTDKGHTLCVANSMPPLNKEKADKIFSEFMQRVEKINHEDTYLYKVKKLILFGSYLNSNNTDFGDIDIAFELERKIKNTNNYDKARRKRIAELKEQGKNFNTFDDELRFPEREVLFALKNKCPYISLHNIEVDIKKKTKCRQIYPIKKKSYTHQFPQRLFLLLNISLLCGRKI